jgi:50S ribosomal subunit-associated GTPase HflX
MEKIKRRNIIPVVALVGYTNVGKSALMNALMKKN